MPKTFYVTTAIPYVNSNPHIGFALEILEADALARYHRLLGEDVRFLTGTDDHGSKIYKLAQSEGVTPQEICDRYAVKFEELKDLLALSNDDFIRTTDQKRHYPGAQELWRRLVKSGDIYKGNYEGLYCSGCEAYLTEKELVDGKCPTHQTAPEKVSEENYFFKLSKYSKQLEQILEENEYEIVPAFRKTEILNVIKEGLRDISFSRPRSVLPWGIPVPDDDEQVMYVWCDALSNYITALDFAKDGKLYQKFWVKGDQRVHVIGKDIVRFHVAIWPAMLLAAGVPLPHKILIHGFVTSNGQKMSKSLGNVVDPQEMVSKYGVDALRYYLLREIPVGKDGDFNLTRFVELFNSDLANNLGNLTNRVLALLTKSKEFPKQLDQALLDQVEKTEKAYHEHFAKFELHLATEDLVKLLVQANQYVDQQKPWELAKTDQGRLGIVLWSLYEVLRKVSGLLMPIMPGAAGRLREKLGLPALETFKADDQKLDYAKLTPAAGTPLFPRIETSK